MKNKNITFVAVIIVVIGSLFLFNSFLKKDIVGENIDINEDIIVPEEPQYFISVPKQVPDSLVFVEKIVLPDGGYVVLYKEKDGKPTAVIGSSEFLNSGVKENFQIKLQNETVAGDVLYAILHLDDGDGVFDVSSDRPVIVGDGKVIFSKFEIVDISEFNNAEKL